MIRGERNYCQHSGPRRRLLSAGRTLGNEGRRGCPETGKSLEQRTNDTNATVTALQGFKRRPAETNCERREGHPRKTRTAHRRQTPWRGCASRVGYASHQEKPHDTPSNTRI